MQSELIQSLLQPHKTGVERSLLFDANALCKQPSQLALCARGMMFFDYDVFDNDVFDNDALQGLCEVPNPKDDEEVDVFDALQGLHEVANTRLSEEAA